MTSRNIQIVNSSEEFFYEVIGQTIKSRSFNLSREAEFYIVKMLSQFMHSDYMFGINSDGRSEDSPLCFILKEAEEEGAPENKRALFRHLGDLALCTTGVFHSKKFSHNYYGTLGKIGYSNAAKLHLDSNLKNLYREMSASFERITFLLRTIPEIRVVKRI